MTCGPGALRRAPLSLSQQSLWLVEHLGASGAYHNLLSVILRGHLDQPALERALQAVVTRHEALRTRFVTAGGTVVQEVLPGAAVVLEDLSPTGGRPRAVPAGEALSRAGQWCRMPFRLDVAPLIRASLTPLDDSGHLLAIAVHHLVSDGDSMTIILRELLAIYAARVSGEPDPLPAVPAQFLDVTAGLAPVSAGPEEAVTFWKEHLRDAPPVLDLPLDRLRPAERAYRGATRRWRFQPSTVAAIRELARAERVSVFMAFLAMAGVLLTRLAGTSEVVIGIPMSLRRDAASRQVVGYLSNTIAVRLAVNPEDSVTALLAGVRRTTLRAYDRSTIPFETVVREIRPPRRLDHNPLFQVLIAFTDRGDEAASRYAQPVAGLELSFPDIEPGMSRVDVSFCVHEVAGSLAVDVEHAADLCDTATAGSLAEALEGLLWAAAAGPQRPVGTLPFSRPPPIAPAALQSRPPAAADPLSGLLDAVLTAAARSPGRAVLACPYCAMPGAELLRAGPAHTGSAFAAAERAGVVLLGQGGKVTCSDVAAALWTLRAPGPVPDGGQGPEDGGPRDTRVAVAVASESADRASLAAAISWLRSARSPLRAGRRVVIAGPVTPTAFAILLAQLAGGDEVVLAGTPWPGTVRADGSDLLVGTTTAILAGWGDAAAAAARLAGIVVTGEPPLVQPWQQLAKRAGDCPVSYLGGPVMAAGVAVSGDVTGSKCAGRVLGHPVGTVQLSIEDANGTAMPPAFPGSLRCRFPGDARSVVVCDARVTGSGDMEMTGPLAPPGSPVVPPLCQLEGVLGAIPGVGDAEAFWDGAPESRYLAAVLAAQPGLHLQAGAVARDLRRRLAPHLLPAELRVVAQLREGPDGWLERHSYDGGNERGLGALLMDALKT